MASIWAGCVKGSAGSDCAGGRGVVIKLWGSGDRVGDLVWLVVSLPLVRWMVDMSCMQGGLKATTMNVHV